MSRNIIFVLMIVFVTIFFFLIFDCKLHAFDNSVLVLIIRILKASRHRRYVEKKQLSVTMEMLK
jgi:hypothetical protein